ncbi:MAG: hypothetical protein KKG09_00065 [Verrucomicrobia bacterium]|nr:hypothetical protein [Verrucomicrobiota bacterium]
MDPVSHPWGAVYPNGFSSCCFTENLNNVTLALSPWGVKQKKQNKSRHAEEKDVTKSKDPLT